MSELMWLTPPPQVPGRCCVPPHPDLRDRMNARLTELAGALGTDSLLPMAKLQAPERRSPGLNDGLIVPGRYFPLGTSVDRARSAGLDRAPLRGTLRVILVLVDFSDLAMTQTAQHFKDLFFSTGVLPHGSVKEYFAEVSHGLIDLAGEVVGPYRMPLKLAEYAHGESGTGGAEPNARTMSRHAAEAADAAVDFTPYDNDANGFVDAFIVVHAGPGGEVSGSGGHIWSHKWVLAGGEYPADSSKIYGYLTIPEDAKIGVCAHELGHLLFGWPDLYDVDGSSEGIGNWCLMAGGSWNLGGDVPAHPSAWCKVNQGWVSVANQAANGALSVGDVKDAYTVHRLWKEGGPGQEYYLLENRQRTRYDAHLPGHGLLIWHIDEAVSGNSDETHYRVALVQADGKKEMEAGLNRGDAGDAYPGSTGSTAFTAASKPSSKSYGGVDTCIAVTSISPSAPVMTVNVAVSCKAKEVKEGKDTKEASSEGKNPFREGKPSDKPFFEKPLDKPFFEKPFEKRWEKPFEKGFEGGVRVMGGPGTLPVPGPLAEIEARLADIEAALGALVAMATGATGATGGGEPFIGVGERPVVGGAPVEQGDPGADPGGLNQQMAAGDARAKRLYDSKMPPET